MNCIVCKQEVNEPFCMMKTKNDCFYICMSCADETISTTMARAIIAHYKILFRRFDKPDVDKI